MSKIHQQKHKPYVTVTEGGAGFFATLVWWNPDMGGFYEPYETGVGRYRSEREAIPEALEWADAEGVEFQLTGYNALGQPCVTQAVGES